MPEDSKNIAIPGWAIRIGGLLLGMLLSVGGVWLAMDRQLSTQEVRLAVLEKTVHDNERKAEQIAVIQRDIEYIREGQKRIESLLGTLDP